MSGEAQFWLGLLLSIPVGIGTSLITPFIQRWFEEKGKERALRQTRHAEAEYSIVIRYQKDRELFTQYLVHVAIKATLVGALLGVISGMFFLGGQLASTLAREMQPFTVQEALFAAGQFAALIGSIMIVNICKPALSLWTKIRNFGEYAAKIPEDIRKRVEAAEGLTLANP